jgi:hypothetical protein
MPRKKNMSVKSTKKKGPGRGWHGSSADHAAAGRKGGLARSARWKQAHSANEETSTMNEEASLA